MNKKRFSFNPNELPRELERHYISASDEDIKSMLAEIGCESLEDLYAHIPPEVRMDNPPPIPSDLDYLEIADHVEAIASKNKILTSFIGDGLGNYTTHPVMAKICSIRGLTTAYTPYQPERSQGTLNSLWIYQSCLAMLTGFEAINASMYERSTCLYEAIQCAVRLKRGAQKALVSQSIYPGDLEVLQTLSTNTNLEIVPIPTNPVTGLIDMDTLDLELATHSESIACLVFPQVNHFGNLEKVHDLTDKARQHNIKSIAVIDPILLSPGGLIAPREFGEAGVDMIVGEGQHLALGPNFGGPGLGIFGIRFNDKCRNDIRSSAGRYVGKALDENGAECKVLVMSTREQHIRKEKATSNICSNQSFVATLAGAVLLCRGDQGLEKIIKTSRENTLNALKLLLAIPGVQLAFPDTPFFNEVTLELDHPVETLLKKGKERGLELGINVSSRLNSSNRNLLMLQFTDKHSLNDIEELVAFIKSQVNGEPQGTLELPIIPEDYLRQNLPGLPNFQPELIEAYYNELGNQNISPDQGPYPLGSCTMKYNPYINDYCASLKGFTDLHPQADIDNAQGALEILWEIQNTFKTMLGLSAVTTQPVAGAQGELVGIKMFQAYHKDHSQNPRDVLLIPRSSHGTNYATATVAGFQPGPSNKDGGLKLIEADETGQINQNQLRDLVNQYKDRIAGIMITNPNTSGIMENRFQEVADLIHSVGGLVYMDGANLNAISGWLDLGKLGVDAVHSNLHKTFSIPHGGGGPGDAIVAVSEKLKDYLPGVQIIKDGSCFRTFKPKKSIGSFHRHYGNFAHKVRCYTYLRALGPDGLRRMSSIAVLSARYMFSKLSKIYPVLPEKSIEPRMHEFILTFLKETFERVEATGIKHALVVQRVGKLFLDFGLHAPTVAWPETYGLMIEPTESYTKAELDRFIDVVEEIRQLVRSHPNVLLTAPHFTPVERIDEVDANKNIQLMEWLKELPMVSKDRITPLELSRMDVKDISSEILKVHQERLTRLDNREIGAS